MAEHLSDVIGSQRSTLVDEHDPNSAVAYLTVCWDGDKIRGLTWTYFDGKTHSAGHTTNGSHTSYAFVPNEYLTSLRLTSSDYGGGDGSVRQIQFATVRPAMGVSGTPTPATWSGGPDDFNKDEVTPLVYGKYLSGFKVWGDDFVWGLAVYYMDKPAVAAKLEGFQAIASFLEAHHVRLHKGER
jgi:hypothetical protein